MRKAKVLSLAFGVLLLVGLPFSSLLTNDSPAKPVAPLSATAQVLEPVLAQQSALEGVYRQWQAQHVKKGGDRHVVVGLGWARGLSHEYSSARGRVDLDLIDGTVRAEVQGLDGQPADLWLVDNQDGPGRTVQPEPGDRMVRIGRLKGGASPGSRRGSAATSSATSSSTWWWSRAPARRRPRAASSSAPVRSSSGSTPTRLAAEREAETGVDEAPVAALPRWSMLVAREAEANSGLLISHGLVSQAVGEGADLFFRGTFSGNGRTCGTCHRADNNQGLDLDFIQRCPPTTSCSSPSSRPRWAACPASSGRP